MLSIIFIIGVYIGYGAMGLALLGCAYEFYCHCLGICANPQERRLREQGRK